MCKNQTCMKCVRSGENACYTCSPEGICRPKTCSVCGKGNMRRVKEDTHMRDCHKKCQRYKE
jgi:hypothetical protein